MVKLFYRDLKKKDENQTAQGQLEVSLRMPLKRRPIL